MGLPGILLTNLLVIQSKTTLTASQGRVKNSISFVCHGLQGILRDAIIKTMKFKALQENLRKLLWGRIERRELTGMRLAQQTGFKQAHISNFLNRKRSLSLEGMDKVLTVQHLSVLDLLDPAEINKRASIMPPSED